MQSEMSSNRELILLNIFASGMRLRNAIREGIQAVYDENDQLPEGRRDEQISRVTENFLLFSDLEVTGMKIGDVIAGVRRVTGKRAELALEGRRHPGGYVGIRGRASPDSQVCLPVIGQTYTTIEFDPPAPGSIEVHPTVLFMGVRNRSGNGVLARSRMMVGPEDDKFVVRRIEAVNPFKDCVMETSGDPVVLSNRTEAKKVVGNLWETMRDTGFAIDSWEDASRGQSLVRF